MKFVYVKIFKEYGYIKGDFIQIKYLGGISIGNHIL